MQWWLPLLLLTVSCFPTPFEDSEEITDLSGGLLLINSGAHYSNLRRVTLALRIPIDATEMMICEDQHFRACDWELADEQRDYTAMQDHLLTLYVKFRDETGVESEILEAEITIDSESPSFQMRTTAWKPKEANMRLSFSVNNVELSGVSQMRVALKENWDESLFQPYKSDYDMPLGREIQAQLIDKAGNRSEIRSFFAVFKIGLFTARTRPATAKTGRKVIVAGGILDDISLLRFTDAADVIDLRSTGYLPDAVLSQARGHLAAASLANSAFFAGGRSGDGLSKRVDRYRDSTESFENMGDVLSVARERLSGIGLRGKAYFAGGQSDGNAVATIDIFDSDTELWETALLSEARYDLAAISYGDQLYFAGGQSDTGFSDRVDIFNAISGTWSQARLSQARSLLAAAAAGGKVIFAGGKTADEASDVVDIYDIVTQTWLTADLSVKRYALAGYGFESIIAFAGGESLRGREVAVDIYNPYTGQWTVSALKKARSYLSAIAVKPTVDFYTSPKLLFVGGETDDGVSDDIEILFSDAKGDIIVSDHF